LAAACFSASAITVIGIAFASAALRAAMTLMILSRSATSRAEEFRHRPRREELDDEAAVSSS
jgi:hypothetical protein